MKKLGSLASIISLACSASVFAEDKENPAIAMSAELGVLITTGNTESSSYLGKLTIDHELEVWRNKYTLDFLQKEAEVTDANGKKVTEETDNRWTGTAKGNYKFTETSAMFIFGSYTSDDYGAYSTYSSLSGGYNFRALEKEKMTLDLDAGVGFVNAETQGTGESDDSELYRGSAAFEWQINDMTKFVQNVSVEHAPGLDNTRTITETGVSASFSTDMQMKFTYKTVSNTEVEPGFEKTDTETSVTLVVNF
jgi:putative salt-induced outer membrane protein YdiY